MQIAKANQNPMAFLLSMACKDPQIKQTVDANGGNIQAAVYQLSKERGMDVNSILGQADQLYKTFLNR